MFRLVGVVKCAITKFAFVISSHAPETAVRFEKQAMKSSASNGHDSAGNDLLWSVGVCKCAITKFTFVILSHRP